MPESTDKPDDPQETVTRVEETRTETKSTVDYKSPVRNKAGLPEKHIEKVVTGEVIVPKKPFGRRFKEAIVAADFKTVGGYLLWDVFIPAVKNMIVDSATKGIERTVYGDRAMRARNWGPGPGNSRVSWTNYQGHSNPVYRATATDVTRGRPVPPDPRNVGDREAYILQSRQEAQDILENMTDIIDSEYGCATVADLKGFLGVHAPHTDNKWGWMNLAGVQVRQVPNGFLIDFPPPTAL